MPPRPLPDLVLEPLVRRALVEDLGRAGDITTDHVVPAAATLRGDLVPRAAGRIAGLEAARLAFQLLDPAVRFSARVHDGGDVKGGTVLAIVQGPARPILTGERTALNFVGRLSGIATLTRAFVRAIEPHAARIVCTRKTTPGLRALEKYAVRAGGGMNHRFGLDDGVLIKDNHLAVAGGVTEAVRRIRDGVGHMVRIQVEVDNLEQLREALDARVDAVLLDNMTPAMLCDAVRLVDGRAITEASGGVTLDSAAAIAATGVDQISVGALTHSAPSLDVGLDVH